MSALWLQIAHGPGGVIGAIVEILIISALTYLAIRTMHGTRGAGVARGVLVIFLFFFIALLFTAHYIRLDNVRWIMENLVGVSLLALVVIFQPEIRRGLIRIGEGTLRFYTGKIVSFEKEVTDAAFQISKRSEVGALIVIERKTQIGSYIESGVSLDARIDARLLITIFTKNTPLHDGAVIIRQGRMAAANCLLPLSENVDVCRGMGTRHRAAIGLSEESDAVIVVVSEETGAVSIALHGKISKGLDYAGLMSMLESELIDADSSGQLIEQEDANA